MSKTNTAKCLIYSVEKHEWQGKIDWEILKDGFRVVATSTIKADAYRIMYLLNFLEKKKQTKKEEKKILRELMV